MGGSFEVKQAARLLDAEFVAKWRDRRSLDPLAWAVLGALLERLVALGGPVRVEEVPALLPWHEPAQVADAIARLDEKDLIMVRDSQVMLAYPFAGTPTPFGVVFPDGRERYAVCAIDALGVPALLDQAVTIRSRCHHCREPLEILVSPDGPIGEKQIMVWVGERGDVRAKGYASL